LRDAREGPAARAQFTNPLEPRHISFAPLYHTNLEPWTFERASVAVVGREGQDSLRFLVVPLASAEMDFRVGVCTPCTAVGPFAGPQTLHTTTATFRRLPPVYLTIS
jgi:hypothetical protein